MKQLEKTFNKIKTEEPLRSSFVCFEKTIRGKNYCRRIIQNYFNKLVPKDDYDSKDKKVIISSLCDMSIPQI